MTVSGEKYEAISTDSGYNKYMILKIRKLSPQDFGSYKCVAKNSLGETDGFIKLDRKCRLLLNTTFLFVTLYAKSYRSAAQTTCSLLIVDTVCETLFTTI